MSLDGIVSIVSFIVGLGIGLLQLYIGQHQFEVQQREKMEELRRLLTDIQQRLAIIEEVNSQRSFDVQNKLLELVAGEEAVLDFTEDTLEKIQEIVSVELKKSGIDNSVHRTKALEEKISVVLENSASSLVSQAAAISHPLLVSREDFIVEQLAKGRTTREIGVILGYSHKTIQKIVDNLLVKNKVETMEDLIKIYSFQSKE